MFKFLKRREEPAPERRAAPAKKRVLPRRDYAAASMNNLNHSWTGAALSADQVIFRNLRILRARARDQYEGNDYARRFIGMLKSHVVGPEGFTFQARTQWSDGKQDKAANDALELSWKTWQRPGNASANGQLPFIEICRLWVATVANDGEVIVRRRLGAKYGKYQYALQFIDPELLDVGFNDDLSNGNIIRFGIEYDEDDRPVAYHFNRLVSGAYSAYSAAQERVRVPADEIWHNYIVERVGQRRGIPWLATPLQRLKMLDGFTEAALVNARVGASKAIFYQQDEDATGDMSGLATLNEEGELVDEIEPGSANILPPGVRPVPYDPTYPNNEFETFVKAQLRSVASGLGVSYHKLANDLEGVNYSSGRLGELEDREVWKAIQGWMVETFLQPLYEDWLSWQLKIGTITVPTKKGRVPLNPDYYDKYTAVRFQGRRWQWTDPLKEENANKLKLDNYLSSPQRIIRESGQDPEEVIADWERWMELLEAAGLPLPQQAQVIIGESKNDEKDEND